MLKRLLERTPLVVIFLPYAAGILTAKNISAPMIFWWMALFTIFLLQIALSRKFSSIIFIMLLMFFLGGMNLTGKLFVPDNHLKNFVESGMPALIRGEVKNSDPRSNGSVKLTLENITMKRTNWESYEGKLLLTIKSADRRYTFGDRIEFRTAIYHPSGRRNPGEFDYKEYLKNHDIYAIAYLSDKEKTKVLGAAGFSIHRIANQVKQKILDLIDRSISGEQNAILKALIVGVRGGIDDETKQDFIDSGVIHILAVSGLHVGIVTIVFWVIFGFLRLQPKPKVIFTILALAFYALIVDLKPSVNRAVIMASIILIAQAWERRTNIYNTLCAAAFIQTLFDPLQLFDMGFQLSFVAVFSIISIYKRFEILLPEKINPAKQNNKYFKYVYQLFLVSLAALLGTLPLTIFYFQRVPVISLVANLFAVPLVGLIGGLGFAQAILGFLWSGINIAYGEVQMILIGILKWMIGMTAEIPFSYFSVKEISTIIVILMYGFIYGILFFDRRKIRSVTIIGGLIILNFWVWSNVFTKPNLKVTFFDVGQGDAALVEFPSGKNMLVDTGDNTYSRNYGEMVIAPFLRRNGIKNIDVMALSHPHSDHIGGAPYLLEHFQVNEIWESDIEAHSKVYRKIHYLADSLNIPVRNLYAGDFVQTTDNVKIFVIHPSKRFIATKPHGYNDYSTTFKMSYGEVDFLFTGDIEEKSEGYIIGFEDFINTEILKVPHHGSSTSSTIEFVNLIHPEYAFVSVGERNKFKHPSPKTITKYENLKKTVYRTDENGALVVETDGVDYWICSW